MCPENDRGEEGLALITALFAVLILVGLSVVFVAMARNATAQSGISRDHETAIHAAEAAIDVMIARVNVEDPDDESSMFVSQYHDGAALTDVRLEFGVMTEEEWALDRAAKVPDGQIIALDGAEAVALRPENSSDTPLDVVYAVGYVPTRAEARRTRVVEVHFQRRLFDPSFAFQTGPACPATGGTGLHMQGNGSIIDGNPDVEPPADVHSNGSVTASGNSLTVEGRISAVGTVDSSLSTQATGGTAGGQPCEDIPLVTPRSMYRTSADPTFWAGGTSERWDLCYEGNIPYARHPNTTGGLPCSNIVGQQNLSSVGSFRGWTFDPNKKMWSGSIHPGIFYIYRASAQITGSAGSGAQAVTVLVESIGTDSAGSPAAGCTGNSNTGNLCISGAPKFVPALKDTAFVVDRDIRMGGNAGTEIGGFVTAGEQISVPGTVSLNGAMIAQDAPHTPGSVVDANRIAGNMTLTFDSTLKPPIETIVQITAWSELK